LKLCLGDCLSVLKTIENNSIHAVVTDPPYGLKFMNKAWDYDVPKVEIWKEVLRVLRPGGHLLSFGGTRTYHRMVVNIEDAGFEIRDQIQWLYGSGFPKSLNLKNEWEGWGTALKPANEPIVMARKPIEKGLTVAENVIKWGTGAINIDASRIGTDNVQCIKKGGGGATFHGQTEKPRMSGSTCGRWPANLFLDEQAAEMLDEQSGILKTGGVGTCGDEMSRGVTAFGGKRKQRITAGDSGGASRFFYVAKASKSERNKGLEGMPEKELRSAGGTTSSGKPTMKGRDRFGSMQVNNHPTVKPIKLMKYLITLVTPQNGIVLDPFMGSGSTGVAAKELGFDFVGIELNEEYLEIAKRRING